MSTLVKRFYSHDDLAVVTAQINYFSALKASFQVLLHSTRLLILACVYVYIVSAWSKGLSVPRKELRLLTINYGLLR